MIQALWGFLVHDSEPLKSGSLLTQLAAFVEGHIRGSLPLPLCLSLSGLSFSLILSLSLSFSLCRSLSLALSGVWCGVF